VTMPPETPQADAADVVKRIYARAQACFVSGNHIMGEEFNGYAQAIERLSSELQAAHAKADTVAENAVRIMSGNCDKHGNKMSYSEWIEAGGALCSMCLKAELQAAKEALAKIVVRSENGELGTSKVRDMAEIAAAALSASPATIPARATSRTAEEVCHNDQLVVWAEELLYALECWIEAPESYDDVVQCGQAAKEEIKRIVECAFELAASPSPDTENGK
jgi:hypothetical protein